MEKPPGKTSGRNFFGRPGEAGPGFYTHPSDGCPKNFKTCAELVSASKDF